MAIRNSQVRFPAFTRTVIVGSCLAILCLLSVSAVSQSQDRLTYEGDKTKPRPLPGKSQTDTQRKTAQSSAQSATPSAPALAAPCVLTTLLVLDDVRTATTRLFNYPPGQTFTVTMTQTNAGILGYSLNSTGPFTETLNVSVILMETAMERVAHSIFRV